MRRLVLILELCLAVSVAHAQTPTPSALSAWVEAPAAGATSARAFVAVNNPTMYDIYIISATADAAGKIEFRAPATGAAEPAMVKEFSVPAYGSTAAEASAPHLRLLDLKGPLKSGDMVQLTLMTDGGIALKVAAPVK
jgi:copper(I)-binding protein